MPKTDDTAALTASLLASGQGDQKLVNAVLQELLAKISRDRLRDMEEDSALEHRKAAMERWRAAKREQVEQEKAKREARQEHCPHMRNQYEPSCGGQRTHSGKVFLVCNKCQKVMYLETMPQRVRDGLGFLQIGGPDNAGMH